VKNINFDSYKPFKIKLKDISYPYTKITHTRKIARAIIFDDDFNFYFVSAKRDDEFGKADLIETSGGGVKVKETYRNALKRELKEELGVEVNIIGYLGEIVDYYNLIYRENLNHYFLCKVVSFTKKDLTKEEINDFHLSTLKITLDEAFALYQKCSVTKIGKLLLQREIIPLNRVKDLLNK